MATDASLDALVPLVPSEGVGSGGAGHQAGTRSMFRLPPPIPGLPGGGYPQEWQDAARLIQSNYSVHANRKKLALARMEDIKLTEDPTSSSGATGGQRIRKRDILMQVAASPMRYVTEVANKVAQNEVVRNFVNQVKRKDEDSIPRPFGQQDDRRAKYAGWMLETVKTKGAAVFYLARRATGSTDEAPFDVARKQPKVEVIEIAARKDLKTTFIVKSGDTLKWTFAVKSHDIAFRVMMRKMMDVGGSDDEELVPAIKVDSSSVGEGTYTVHESGRVVMSWDNTYSLLRSKTVAYRAWVDKTETEGMTNEQTVQQTSSLENLQASAGQNESVDVAARGDTTGEESIKMEQDRQKADEQKQAEDERKKAEEEKITADRKAEEERIAAQKGKEEEERKATEARIAAEKKEEERKKAEMEAMAAQQKADEEKKAQEQRVAAEKRAEEERLAMEKQAAEDKKKAEDERIAGKERLEAERKAEEAKKKAEDERIAAEKKAEEEKIAAEKKAEAEKIAAEKKAEEEKIAAEKKAEEEKVAAEERIAAEKKAAEEAKQAEEAKAAAESENAPQAAAAAESEGTEGA